MGDTVTTRTLYSGTKKLIQQYTNVSDGTGESAVSKLDISTLTNSAGETVTAIKINRIWGNVSGMVVNILTDHSSDVLMFTANDGLDFLDFTDSETGFGGIKDTGSGGTGDVLFTTVGHTAADSYNLFIEYGLK
jgi:hypothetical protein